MRDGGSDSGRGDTVEQAQTSHGVGDEAQVGSHTAVVTGATIEGDPLYLEANYLVVDVALANQGAEPLTYNGDEWVAMTPSGARAEAIRRPVRMAPGELGPGQRVEGQISFFVGAETTGDFRIEHLGLTDDPGSATWTVAIEP